MANAQILVVEDEAIIARSIQRELTDMGYDVPAIASSGKEALEKAAQTHPDLVLMDVVLKGDMDGVETTEELRAYHDVPVVYLTAYADDDTLERAKKTEPFGYLLKPYDERELRATIELALYKHRMEGVLHEIQQWLTSTLQCVGDAVIVTDARGYIRMTNHVAEKLTGWSQHQALGKELLDVFHPVNGQSRARVDIPTAEAFRKGVAVNLENQSLLRARDGRETPVEGSVAPIYDDLDNFIGFVLVFRDSTERTRINKALGQSEDHLRRWHEMEAIGRDAGGMVHDFNQLLTAILGHISLVLSRLPDADPNRDLLVTAERAALEAVEVVSQLLGFSHRRMPQQEPVHLNDVIRESLELLRRMIASEIAIEFEPARDLGTVQGSAAQIKRVLLNLCLNARDAMPQGGQLLIQTRNVVFGPNDLPGHAQAKPGDHVRLRVSDTGQGIPPEIRSRIFEPFFTTKGPGKGTGLGLAMVSSIVEQQGGWIECSSEVGQGTCFDIYLPRADSEKATGPAMTGTQSAGEDAPQAS